MRRLGHALRHQRQHLRPGDDDGREGRRPHPRQHPAGPETPASSVPPRGLGPAPPARATAAHCRGMPLGYGQTRWLRAMPCAATLPRAPPSREADVDGAFAVSRSRMIALDEPLVAERHRPRRQHQADGHLVEAELAGQVGTHPQVAGLSRNPHRQRRGRCSPPPPAPAMIRREQVGTIAHQEQCRSVAGVHHTEVEPAEAARAAVHATTDPMASSASTWSFRIARRSAWTRRWPCRRRDAPPAPPCRAHRLSAHSMFLSGVAMPARHGGTCHHQQRHGRSPPAPVGLEEHQRTEWRHRSGRQRSASTSPSRITWLTT